MTYKDLLLHHLAEYRRDVLNVTEPGSFTFRKREVSVEHILPKDKPWLGIPAEVRDEVRAFSAARNIKLHRYFHHLNSSQAFALSLFVPFFEGGTDASSALLRALGTPGALGSWEPESIRDRKEGTNLDAWWRTSDGRECFCEVKLTESEFGVAANDAAHQKKLSDIYAPRLASHLKPSRLTPQTFFQSYQVLRNLWYAAASKDARVVFLYPRQQKVLTALLEPVLKDITSDVRDRVVVAHSEDVLARVHADEACPLRLRAYAGTLAQKYLLAAL